MFVIIVISLCIYALLLMAHNSEVILKILLTYSKINSEPIPDEYFQNQFRFNYRISSELILTSFLNHRLSRRIYFRVVLKLVLIQFFREYLCTDRKPD